jgi:hypothetical protein
VLTNIQRQLSRGHLLFETESVVQRGKASVVIARIARGTTTDLRAGLPNGRQFKVERIDVAITMRVELTPEDPSSVVITPLGASDQLLSFDGFATWMWSINAIRGGEIRLRLLVYALMQNEGQQKPQLAADRTISVRVTESPAAQLRSKSEEFVHKMLDKLPELVVGAIWIGICSGLLILWRKIRKRHTPAHDWEKL